MAKKRKKYLVIGFAFLFVVAAYISTKYYLKIYGKVSQFDQSEIDFYVETGSDLNQLTQQLYKQKIISDTNSFLWVANQKKFNQPKAGRYILKGKVSNNSLVNLFRSGAQSPIKLTFNGIRTKESFAGRIAQQLEVDSSELLNQLRNPEIAAKYGFDSETIMSLFIPNTYEFYWNTSADEFIQRMTKEYKRFWNSDRKAKATKLGMTQSEVSILAAIVQTEQMEHADERAKVAGLYLNRLKKGMRLQSDPTLIYAIGDYSIRRVLNKHKVVDSPFNTYKYSGLPPGLIYLPDPSSIDAVLNAEQHDYIYMCAKADFSGYHNFARTLSQHNQYAKAYQRELNRRKIMR